MDQKSIVSMSDEVEGEIEQENAGVVDPDAGEANDLDLDAKAESKDDFSAPLSRQMSQRSASKLAEDKDIFRDVDNGLESNDVAEVVGTGTVDYQESKWLNVELDRPLEFPEQRKTVRSPTAASAKDEFEPAAASAKDEAEPTAASAKDEADPTALTSPSGDSKLAADDGNESFLNDVESVGNDDGSFLDNQFEEDIINNEDNNLNDSLTPLERFRESVYSSLSPEIASKLIESLLETDLHDLIVRGNKAGFRLVDDDVEKIVRSILTSKIPLEALRFTNHRITSKLHRTV